ncbi:class I SAM-dependent methyltransferase [Dactylosporangium darangshiense]
MSERMLAGNLWRERQIARHLSPHLRATDAVLDLGAGSCKLAKLLIGREGLEVIAVDVVDHNVTDLPLTLYDGERLPFADGSFDTVLLIFVLHHAADPDGLLREALRLSRRQVLVVEDAPVGRWQARAWRVWDYLLNHGSHDDVAIAHEARSVRSWRDWLDAATGLEPAVVRTFRTAFPLFWTVPHVLLVVRPR